jgi:hypothetical protein
MANADFTQDTRTLSIENAMIVKSKLLSLLSKVNSKASMNDFIVEMNKYFPLGSRVIIVVGARVRTRYSVCVVANDGWPIGWVACYNQQRFFLVDPIWNGPCGKLMVWSQLLKKASILSTKKFVGFASSEGLEFGVSWKKIVDDKTFLISVKGRFIEEDYLSHYILRSICDQIIDVAMRVVEKHPEIAILDSREYQAIVSMFQYPNDLDAAEKSGMSLGSYRYTLRAIQKRFLARNRFDMIRKVFHLS